MDKLETMGKWRKIALLADNVFKIVFKWFLADVAFTLLPISVIILIDYITIGKIDFLRLSPLWSFATIVFLGLSITRLIELKTVYQRDLSHKIYSGTILFVILLIFAVIILSLVVLRDQGLNINNDLL
jgi:hypothetical protein